MTLKILYLILSCPFFVCADDYGFTDPYPEVYEQVELLPFRPHGWRIHEDFFDPLLASKIFHTVIEVGVFAGKWTIHIAEQLPDESRFFAVDHWKGSEEHFSGGSFEKDLLKNLYQQFLSNVIHKHLTNKVIPVRMNSLQAARKFAALNIKGDLIYIDASHDHFSVIKDLEAWYPLLAPGGTFCGDDWNIGDVQFAVQHFAQKKKLQIVIHGTCWELRAMDQE